jgi:hypothetical protein
MTISQYRLSRILLDEMESIGLERSFNSLTIEELNNLSKRLIVSITRAEQIEDEPPF